LISLLVVCQILYLIYFADAFYIPFSTWLINSAYVLSLLGALSLFFCIFWDRTWSQSCRHAPGPYLYWLLHAVSWRARARRNRRARIVRNFDELTFDRSERGTVTGSTDRLSRISELKSYLYVLRKTESQKSEANYRSAETIN